MKRSSFRPSCSMPVRTTQAKRSPLPPPAQAYPAPTGNSAMPIWSSNPSCSTRAPVSHLSPPLRTVLLPMALILRLSVPAHSETRRQRHNGREHWHKHSRERRQADNFRPYHRQRLAPSPAYLASDQAAPSTDSAPLTLETLAESSSVDTTAEGTSTTSNLAPPTDPALALPKVAGPDMGMGTGEQLTGRAPSGPLAELPDTPSSPSTSTPTSTSPSLTSTSPTLGRVRGNTGPLGPSSPR